MITQFEFRDVKVSWGEHDLVLRGRKRFVLVQKIEEIITISDLAAGRRVAMTRIATAMHLVLKACGLDLDEEDVFLGMFGGDAAAGGDPAKAAGILLAVMMPTKIEDVNVNA